MKYSTFRFVAEFDLSNEDRTVDLVAAKRIADVLTKALSVLLRTRIVSARVELEGPLTSSERRMARRVVKRAE